MNIHNNSAGCVSGKHIESKGFEVFEIFEGNDMGQMSYSMPQYQNDKIQILGGYWNYVIKDRETGNQLFEGWWNSNEEFDNTIDNLK